MFSGCIPVFKDTFELYKYSCFSLWFAHAVIRTYVHVSVLGLDSIFDIIVTLQYWSLQYQYCKQFYYLSHVQYIAENFHKMHSTTPWCFLTDDTCTKLCWLSWSLRFSFTQLYKNSKTPSHIKVLMYSRNSLPGFLSDFIVSTSYKGIHTYVHHKTTHSWYIATTYVCIGCLYFNC